MYIKKLKNNRGFVILFAVTLSSILLTITLGVMNVAIKELRFGTSARDTNDAFLAADTGIEKALLNDKAATNAYPGEGTWNFAISSLGSGGQGCVKVTVTKTLTPSVTTLLAKGYNNGGTVAGACNPGTNSVERELKITYGGPSSASSVCPGNTIQVSGTNYCVETFTATGTFTVPASGTSTVQVLVVGGGGGGGANGGGGGGAGGVFYNPSYSVTANQAITVTVGGGGAGAPVAAGGETHASNGGNSVFGTITAIGGGGGGSGGRGDNGAAVDFTGQNGGSGGGAGKSGGSSGTGTSGQGNNGGSGGLSGGGGAGAAGSSLTAEPRGGAGGDGIASAINGSNTMYAGGGGAAWPDGDAGGAGGSGGGGHGGTASLSAGIPNSGSGGGAGGAGTSGAAGGAGVVIVRYVIP